MNVPLNCNLTSSNKLLISNLSPETNSKSTFEHVCKLIYNINRWFVKLDQAVNLKEVRLVICQEFSIAHF